MFYPSDFKAISGILINTLDEYKEARIRTSISRLYYYIFLEVRELMLKIFEIKDKKKFKKLKYKHHSLIPKILIYIGEEIEDEKIIKIGNKLKFLRNIRNESDYNLIAVFEIEHYTSVEEKIKEIDLDYLKQKLNQEILAKALNELIN